MRAVALSIAVLVLLADPANAETIAGRASVIDADTLELQGQRIRILDIDAPETRQPCRTIEGEEWRCGQSAALAVSDWIGARPVICETSKRDRYKRWLAHCTVAGENLAVWDCRERMGHPLSGLHLRCCPRCRGTGEVQAARHLVRVIHRALGLAQGAARNAMNQATYQIGDTVLWGTPTAAGEYTFIGYPRGDTAGNVLVLAHSGEIGFEVNADECAPTGRSNPQRGQEYRLRYFRNHPRGLEGNP